jgi:Ribbon-helix-helix domain
VVKVGKMAKINDGGCKGRKDERIQIPICPDTYEELKQMARETGVPLAVMGREYYLSRLRRWKDAGKKGPNQNPAGA